MTGILDNLAKEVDKISGEKNSPKKKIQKTTTTPLDLEENDSIMNQLMEASELKFPEIGETINGKVIDVSSNEIYLDLAPFGAGIVMGKEIKDGLGTGKLKIGNIVTATIIDLENENGYIELSIREASYEKAWDDLESKRDTQEKVKVKVLSANRGGLLAEVNGISGFLPVSQLSSKNYPRVEDGDKNKILNLLKKLMGQELEVRIIDADRETEKLIVSEKAAQSEHDMEVISSLTIGDTVNGEISGVVDFGAFIKFSLKEKDEPTHNATHSVIDGERKLEGLVHISELAWQLIEDPRTIVKVGDKINAKIIGIDGDKISLSIRALQKDPWLTIDTKYKKGDKVLGTVNKINHFGVFVYLDQDIHGLAHISEMSENYPGKSLKELVKVGEKYTWEILSIESNEHRMGLILAKKEDKNKSNSTKITIGKKEKVEKEKKKEKEKPIVTKTKTGRKEKEIKKDKKNK